MRNITKFNVTCPAYIGGERNTRGKEICEAINRVVMHIIEKHDEPNTYDTYKSVVDLVMPLTVNASDLGIVIVGAPD